MDAKTTGRFLAELRKEKGYTQKELGDKLMVTDKAISRWETGKGQSPGPVERTADRAVPPVSICAAGGSGRGGSDGPARLGRRD